MENMRKKLILASLAGILPFTIALSSCKSNSNNDNNKPDKPNTPNNPSKPNDPNKPNDKSEKHMIVLNIATN